MTNHLPTRKKNRLPKEVYAAAGIYFITICTEERRFLFWKNSEEDTLSEYGLTAKRILLSLPDRFPAIRIIEYCIMPDHIHLLISLRPDETASGKTSIQNVVGCFKARTTKAIGTGKTVWQKGFYDHIVRGQEDFDSVRQYIQFNPYIYLEKKKEGKS